MKKAVMWMTSLAAVTTLFSGASAFAYVAREYAGSVTDLPIGTIVALDGKGGLTRATTGSSSYAGVVASIPSPGQVAVANQGVVKVYVTTADGAISAGSKIGISQFGGVGALWQPGEQEIGVAGQAIDPSMTETVQASGSGGAKQSVKVALISVNLLPGTDNAPAMPQTGFEATLTNIANAIAGHSVAFWRVVAAFITGLAALFVAFVLLLTSSRGSFLALGRNPLASEAILRGMWRSVAVSVVVIIVGIIAAYLFLEVGS